MTAQQRSHREVVDATVETEANMKPQRVPVNVYEAGEALVVLAPMPAVTADDITIELRPPNLRFYASLRSSGPREYLVREWEYGGYEREVDVPEGFGSAVEATLVNGQLAIRVMRGEPTGEMTVKPRGS